MQNIKRLVAGVEYSGLSGAESDLNRREIKRIKGFETSTVGEGRVSVVVGVKQFAGG